MNDQHCEIPACEGCRALLVILADLRLKHANLLAAARATVAAADEGEPDPHAYLRDELSAGGRAQ